MLWLEETEAVSHGPRFARPVENKRLKSFQPPRGEITTAIRSIISHPQLKKRMSPRMPRPPSPDWTLNPAGRTSPRSRELKPRRQNRITRPSGIHRDPWGQPFTGIQGRGSRRQERRCHGKCPDEAVRNTVGISPRFLYKGPHPGDFLQA